MPRIQPIELDQAQPKAKALLESVNKSLGITPNIMRTMAQSPATLEAYLGLGKALSGSATRLCRMSSVKQLIQSIGYS